MREALVAVFDTAPHADQAVRALEMANVPPTDIRRYHKDDPSIPHANYLSQTGQQGTFIPKATSWLLVMVTRRGASNRLAGPRIRGTRRAVLLTLNR